MIPSRRSAPCPFSFRVRRPSLPPFPFRGATRASFCLGYNYQGVVHSTTTTTPGGRDGGEESSGPRGQRRRQTCPKESHLPSLVVHRRAGAGRGDHEARGWGENSPADAPGKVAAVAHQ